MKYVIIGNSTAGIGAVEGIRQIDKSGGITIISSEPHHTYSRPLISYFVKGKVTREDMNYRPAGFYADNDCAFVHGTVTRIDSENKQVILESGKSVQYDKLLVATGSSPVVLPNVIQKATQNFTFTSLDDALKLEAALDNTKRVLIIGAGLIGLKCAEGIAEKAASVTVCDLSPRILSSILDEEGAAIVQKHIESKGIKFLLGQSAEDFSDYDIVVTAVGVKPNTALLDTIADIDKGIIVNAKSETTAPNIYAAGDCTQINGKPVMALLPNAYIQGETAGINMAGGEKSFDKAIAMNAIGFFGLNIATAGEYKGNIYAKGNKRLFYSDNRLNGFIIIGDVEKCGIYTSLIREQTPLDSIDFDLICEKPGLMAFSKTDREIKLGGAVQ